MAPTIVYRDGKPVLVIGAPGATRIITSVLQVMLNVLDFGMSPSEAVLAPRFDCQGDLITCQPRIPGYVCDEVARRHPGRGQPEQPRRDGPGARDRAGSGDGEARRRRGYGGGGHGTDCKMSIIDDCRDGSPNVVPSR